jgi:dTDP-glucose 4,6-dehydratase
MKNILVTGGAGFIGSNFVRYLLQAEPDVYVVNLDLLSYAGSQENLKNLPFPHHHTFVRGDICDRPLIDHLFHLYKIDTVVNFAAETHVDRNFHPSGSGAQLLAARESTS